MNVSPTAQQEPHEWNNFSALQSFLDSSPEEQSTVAEPVPNESTNSSCQNSFSDQISTVLCDAVTPSPTKCTLYNGRVIVILSSSTTWWSPGFDLSACRKYFDEYGLQVPAEDYEVPIQKSLQTAEVRRYMFFSSSAFFMILSPVLYVAVWCSLFTTVHSVVVSYHNQYFWLFCLLLSAGSAFLTGIFLMIVYSRSKKINVNTDIRLIWANENLIKHSVLVGLMDFMQNCKSELKLSFIYFDARECLRRLTSLLEEDHGRGSTFQSKACKKLKHLCIMLEQTPEHTFITEESEDDGISEETPLLWGERHPSQATTSVHGQKTPAFNVVLNLVPEGTTQDMAYQLLSIHAGLYVKLLLTCQLPFSSSSHHAKEACVPCLCQYIETTLFSASRIRIAREQS